MISPAGQGVISVCASVVRSKVQTTSAVLKQPEPPVWFLHEYTGWNASPNALRDAPTLFKYQQYVVHEGLWSAVRSERDRSLGTAIQKR